jgi:hypothetical protein
MQFAIGVIVLECTFVKYNHGPLGLIPFVCEKHTMEVTSK